MHGFAIHIIYYVGLAERSALAEGTFHFFISPPPPPVHDIHCNRIVRKKIWTVFEKLPTKNNPSDFVFQRAQTKTQFRVRIFRQVWIKNVMS